MQVKPEMKQTLRKLILGETDLPQASDISLRYPQNEIHVHLFGTGLSRDVTRSHSVACAAPFTFCIGLESSGTDQLVLGRSFTLEFSEIRGRGKVLGAIELTLQTKLSAEDHWIGLFKAIKCQNYCLPKYRLIAHELVARYRQRKSNQADKMQISRLDTQCNAVTFICPRPVVLVSIVDGNRGNIFPMNLLGDLGGNYFAFALNSERRPARLVAQLGRLTLSTVPLNKSAIVRELGRNHYVESTSLSELPFALRQSDGLGISYPEFGIRIIGLQVIEVRPLGSHTLFLAKTIEKAINVDAEEFHMIHGYYAAHRKGQDK